MFPKLKFRTKGERKHRAPRQTRVVGSDPFEDMDGRPLQHPIDAIEADRDEVLHVVYPEASRKASR